MENSPLSNGIITIRFLFILLPILMGTAHCLWRRHIRNAPKADYFLAYFLTIGVGLQNLIIGHLEIYHGDLVADYVGWASSPCLSDLGKAHIAFGIVGVLGFWFRAGWRSAAAITYGLYLTMMGTDLFRNYMYNPHPYHEIVRPLILSDFLMALCLFSLLFWRYRTSQSK